MSGAAEADTAPKWSAVVVACAGSFVAALSTSLVAVAAPVIARDLHASQADVGWVLSAYLLAISCLLAGIGRLADVLGRRRVYLAGFVVFALASVASGAATTLPSMSRSATGPKLRLSYEIARLSPSATM